MLRRLGETFFNKRDFPASAHCFEQFYHGHLPHFEAMPSQELAISLQVFQMYIRGLFTLTFQTDPRDSPVASRLFGFALLKDNQFFIPNDTFFSARIEENRFYLSVRTGEGFLISAETLKQVYRNTLEAYLKNLLLQENESCLRSRMLNPCINFVVQGNCKKEGCFRDHQQLSNYDSKWYNSRIHVHLVQISIIQMFASLLNYQEVNRYRRCTSIIYQEAEPSDVFPGYGSPNYTMLFTRQCTNWARSPSSAHHSSRIGTGT